MSGAGLQEEGQIAVSGLTAIYKELSICIATYPSNIEGVEVEFVMTRQREEGDTKGCMYELLRIYRWYDYALDSKIFFRFPKSFK